MSLKNISVKQYSQSQSVVGYDSLLTAMYGKNEFYGKKFDLNKLSYHAVRKIEKLLKKGKTFDDLCSIFKLSFGCSESEFWNSGIYEFYLARNFLQKEIESLMLQEKSLLMSDGVNLDAWETAGGKSLEPFGDILPLMKLGKIYSIYPFEMGHKPYNEIMALLVAHKRSDSVDQKYHELTRPKQKTR